MQSTRKQGSTMSVPEMARVALGVSMTQNCSEILEIFGRGVQRRKKEHRVPVPATAPQRRLGGCTRTNAAQACNHIGQRNTQVQNIIKKNSGKVDKELVLPAPLVCRVQTAAGEQMPSGIRPDKPDTH